MAEIAPSVYDNLLVRTLLGFNVYTLPAGAISHAHYLEARKRLREVDILLLCALALVRDERITLSPHFKSSQSRVGGSQSLILN